MESVNNNIMQGFTLIYTESTVYIFAEGYLHKKVPTVPLRHPLLKHHLKVVIYTSISKRLLEKKKKRCGLKSQNRQGLYKSFMQSEIVNNVIEKWLCQCSARGK